MLRLTKIETPTEQRLILEGRLTGPWVADVCANWEELRHAHHERNFVVDLRGITRIDQNGENALALTSREADRTKCCYVECGNRDSRCGGQRDHA